MARVVCDTSFLMHLATARIRNLDNLGVEIGSLEFVVPQVVRNELERLSDDPDKAGAATAALNIAKTMKTIPISGRFADSALVNYLRVNPCIIGTMDRRLKRQAKEAGSSVLSFSNNRIVLEPQ